jgi:hypothetical protein
VSVYSEVRVNQSLVSVYSEVRVAQSLVREFILGV